MTAVFGASNKGSLEERGTAWHSQVLPILGCGTKAEGTTSCKMTHPTANAPFSNELPDISITAHELHTKVAWSV